MPFFDTRGNELPQDECQSRHVYSPSNKVLTRDELRSLIETGGYRCQVVDPSDLRLLPEGTLESEVLLIAREPGILEGLPRHLVRTSILAAKDLVLIDLMVESPFNAVQVLGPLDNLATTLGEEGLRCLKSANSMYAINVPQQTSSLADRVLDDVATVIAKKLSGKIYDPDQGNFVS